MIGPGVTVVIMSVGAQLQTHCSYFAVTEETLVYLNTLCQIICGDHRDASQNKHEDICAIVK